MCQLSPALGFWTLLCLLFALMANRNMQTASKFEGYPWLKQAHGCFVKRQWPLDIIWVSVSLSRNGRRRRGYGQTRSPSLTCKGRRGSTYYRTGRGAKEGSHLLFRVEFLFPKFALGVTPDQRSFGRGEG